MMPLVKPTKAEMVPNVKPVLGLRDTLAEAADDEPCPTRHEVQTDDQDRDEHDQPAVEVGEQRAEREDGAEVVDEARGQNQLAQLGAIQPSLDHHRVVIGSVGFLGPFFGAWLFTQYIAGWQLHEAWIAGIALSTTSVAVVLTSA